MATWSARLSLPELASNPNQQLLRIPGELDVPLTGRVRRLLDTQAMQRLRRVSQLGLVAMVYPGALHSRFEHSLGVYRLARITLLHLLDTDQRFAESLTEEDAKTFLVAALVHDVGHWPYCHPIEDMRLPWVRRHEELAQRVVGESPLADVVREDWKIDPQRVASFLSKASPGASASLAERVLRNVLDGPIDIDKMDYLQRDSLHAGVPYGRNFDIGRLTSSLRLADDRASISITEKGKTAAEMMVFARYVMFSEVYWHHTVRSATAMLQRLVFRHIGDHQPRRWLEMDDAAFESELCRVPSELSNGLFGRNRQLFKRLAQFSYAEDPEVHGALARRPFAELVRCSEILGELLSQELPRPLGPDDVLIDAPPVKLEVQFQLSVVQNDGSSRSLAELSPVVRALATDQFDNQVKRVRIFMNARRRQEVQLDSARLKQMLLQSIAELESSH